MIIRFAISGRGKHTGGVAQFVQPENFIVLAWIKTLIGSRSIFNIAAVARRKNPQGNIGLPLRPVHSSAAGRSIDPSIMFLYASSLQPARRERPQYGPRRPSHRPP